jgi:TatD DNase family protein
MLVDHHCHLDFPDFAGDREAVIARAHAAGVEMMVTVCTRISRIANVLAVAQADKALFCTVGTHPHNAAEELAVGVDEIVRLAGHSKVVAIGESGLDFFYDNSPRPAQLESFRKHIAAARATGLPLVIHARDADDVLADLLEEETAKGRFEAVLHCFTGGPALARRALDLGFYISFSGILTFKNAEELRRIAAAVPLERLLVETDAPYLAPVPYRGKRNEPAYVVKTAAALAQLKGLAEGEIARATTENFFRLYAKAVGQATAPATAR